MATGVNVSKAVGYAVLDKPTGASVTKTVGYAALQAINAGVNVSKVVGYAVLQEASPVSPSTQQPVISFFGL